LPKLNIFPLLVVFLSLLIAGAGALGDSDCRQENNECVTIGDWDFSIGIGIGGRTNPIINSDDIPIVLLPTVSYYGKRFFWDTDTLGYTLVESKQHMINIIGTISYDQAFFNEWGVGNFVIGRGSGGSAGRVESNFQIGGEDLSSSSTILSDDVIDLEPTPPPPEMGTGETIRGPLVDNTEAAIDLDRLHSRDLAGLMGFEYALNIDKFGFAVQALRDVTSVHDGDQVSVALLRHFNVDKHIVGITLGAEWRDSKTLDYFYGVREDEVDDPLHAYELSSDTSYYVKIDWRYRLSEKWEFRSVLHHRVLGDEIKNSPVVSDDTTTAVFFGGVYHF